jgi:toxin CptA
VPIYEIFGLNRTVLTIHLQPSYRLAVILVLAHLVAAGLLWPLALSWNIAVIIVAMLIVSLFYYLRKDAMLTAQNAVVVLTLPDDEMTCVLTTRSGESVACSIQGSSFVASYLTVINLKPSQKFFARSVVILPDGIDAEEFRRLRVWLRWRWKNDQEKV